MRVLFTWALFLCASLSLKQLAFAEVIIDFNGSPVPINTFVTFPSSLAEDGYVITQSVPTNSSNIPYNGVIAKSDRLNAYGNNFSYAGIDGSNYLALGWNTYWLTKQDGGVFDFLSLQANISIDGYSLRMWSYSDVNHTQDKAEIGLFFPFNGSRMSYFETLTFTASQNATGIRCIELVPTQGSLTPNNVINGLAIDNIKVTSVPEPTSLSLLALGGLALVINKRRRA